MRLFQTAYDYFRENKHSEALRYAQRAMEQGDRPADASHLLALIYKQQQATATAEYWFTKSLAIEPAQPVVWANYANFLQQHQNWDQAEQAYSNALALAPTLADAWFNYGLLARRQHQLITAQARLFKAQQYNPKSVAVAFALSECYSLLGDYTSALAVLTNYSTQFGLQADVQKAKVQLLRAAMQPDAALLELAMLPKDSAGDWYHLAGCIHYDLQQYPQTEHALLQAIAQNAGHIPAHEALNKLYWEHQLHDKFLVYSQHTLTQYPELLELRLIIIDQLLKSTNYATAQTLIDQGFAYHPTNGALSLLQAQLYDRQQLTEQALRSNSEALRTIGKGHPLAVRVWLDQAHYLMKLQRANEATQYLDLALAQAPDNQEVWAFAGTCWRLLGDKRHDWLNDYTRLIDVQPLPVPDGFCDLPSFLLELKAVVHQLHTTNIQPLDQSVRGGTQTLGRLLEHPHPLIQKLRGCIERQLQRYLNNLPNDATHPLLRRNSKKYRFSGSWSVRLQSNGYHSNHVHPEGWLSACVYLDVPASIRADDPLHRGWLKLGETCLGLADQEVVAKHICPTPGLMVIFPSYMWHGTVPFDSDSRLTVPFDIMPLN